MKQSVSVLSMSILWLLFVLPGTGIVSGSLLGLLTVTAVLWAFSSRWMAVPVPVTIHNLSVIEQTCLSRPGRLS